MCGMFIIEYPESRECNAMYHNIRKISESLWWIGALQLYNSLDNASVVIHYSLNYDI